MHEGDPRRSGLPEGSSAIHRLYDVGVTGAELRADAVGEVSCLLGWPFVRGAAHGVDDQAVIQRLGAMELLVERSQFGPVRDHLVTVDDVAVVHVLVRRSCELLEGRGIRAVGTRRAGRGDGRAHAESGGRARGEDDISCESHTVLLCTDLPVARAMHG
ncbi:hypothetical protein ABE10_01750 [Bacillus toyonensis]|nr:hypothetical protein [Bacillus toyonensis]